MDPAPSGRANNAGRGAPLNATERDLAAAWNACAKLLSLAFEIIMADQDITLRLARASEAPVIAAMSRDLIETGLGWSWDSERVARAIRARDTTALVACDRMRVAGFAIMHFGDEHAHLNLLAVRPSHQRQGIGRCMVNWLIESALVAGIATVTLELRTANTAARRFYQSLGFADATHIPGYYRGRETALRTSRALRQLNIELPRWSMPSQG